MPYNGYWIECIPVTNGDAEHISNTSDTSYQAEVASIPEAKVFADTPDHAIQQLRDKLKALRSEYRSHGKEMPEHDNPVRPPRNMGSIRGWISVYVKMGECAHHHS
jgi:hypothetical protein